MRGSPACSACAAARVASSTPSPTIRISMSSTPWFWTLFTAKGRVAKWRYVGMTTLARIVASSHHQRAGAVVGEKLEQHGMRHPPIEDDDAFDAGLEGIETGLDFGNHAARNGAVGDQAAGIVGGELLDQLFRLVENAGHVGQDQEPLGLERASDGARERVGVDIVGDAFG